MKWQSFVFLWTRFWFCQNNFKNTKHSQRGKSENQKTNQVFVEQMDVAPTHEITNLAQINFFFFFCGWMDTIKIAIVFIFVLTPLLLFLFMWSGFVPSTFYQFRLCPTHNYLLSLSIPSSAFNKFHSTFTPAILCPFTPFKFYDDSKKRSKNEQHFLFNNLTISRETSSIVVFTIGIDRKPTFFFIGKFQIFNTYTHR